jgi:hypothetical protein
VPVCLAVLPLLATGPAAGDDATGGAPEGDGVRGQGQVQDQVQDQVQVQVQDPEGKKWDAGPMGAPAAGTREVPWVHLVNLYTGDALPVFGEAVSGSSFARLLRCRATGDVRPIDPALAGTILGAAERLRADVVEVLSGYRSEKFNEQLRKKGHEVASESFHRRGQAVDWRLRGVPLERLVAYLARRHDGGLGVYRRSDFVHTDVGPKREWRGR